MDLFRRQAAKPQLDRSAALREAMVEMIEKRRMRGRGQQATDSSLMRIRCSGRHSR
jgi:hypothetical protein